MDRLRLLDLQWNCLESIPVEIEELASLETLQLSNNKVCLQGFCLYIVRMLTCVGWFC